MEMTIQRKDLLLWLLLGGIALFALWIRIGQFALYPVHEDELLTLQLLKSIHATGLPLTETGQIYWRSLFGNYLTAIPVLFAVPTLEAARLVPIVCSALVILCMGWFGRLAGSPWSGVLAGTFLAVSSFQGMHANFARFYLPFQLFFLMATLACWGYFGARFKGAGWFLVLTVCAAIGTQEFAVQLLPVALLAWVLGGRREVWREWRFYGGGALIVGCAALLWLWQPTNVHTGEGALPLVIAGLDDKLAFWRLFRDVTPLGWTLILLGLYPLFKKPNHYCFFLYAALTVCFIGTSLLAPADNPRYMAHLYPLGVFLATLALVAWSRLLWTVLHDDGSRPKAKQLALPLLLLLAAGGYAWATADFSWRTATGVALRFPDQGPAHAYLRQVLHPDARLISTEPAISAYYLNRPADFWLREQYDQKTGSYHPFAEHLKSAGEQFYIDSPQKLLALLRQTHEELWLYANWKIVWAISPEMDRIVREHFRPRYVDGETYVLVRPAPGPP